MSFIPTNWATATLGAKLIDFSSDIKGCEAENILEPNLPDIWLTEHTLPQWVCISLADVHQNVTRELQSNDLIIRTVGWHCWHPYTTNPKSITVHVSADGTKFKLWDTLTATQVRGTQLFCCAPINCTVYPFVAYEITETFGGIQTYMNRIYLFSEEVSMHQPSSPITIVTDRTESEDDQSSAAAHHRDTPSTTVSESIPITIGSLSRHQQQLQSSQNDQQHIFPSPTDAPPYTSATSSITGHQLTGTTHLRIGGSLMEDMGHEAALLSATKFSPHTAPTATSEPAGLPLASYGQMYVGGDGGYTTDLGIIKPLAVSGDPARHSTRYRSRTDPFIGGTADRVFAGAATEDQRGDDVWSYTSSTGRGRESSEGAGGNEGDRRGDRAIRSSSRRERRSRKSAARNVSGGQPLTAGDVAPGGMEASVWPTAAPELNATSPFAAVVDRIAGLEDKITGLSEAVTSLRRSQPHPRGDATEANVALLGSTPEVLSMKLLDKSTGTDATATRSSGTGVNESVQCGVQEDLLAEAEAAAVSELTMTTSPASTSTTLNVVQRSRDGTLFVDKGTTWESPAKSTSTPGFEGCISAAAVRGDPYRLEYPPVAANTSRQPSGSTATPSLPGEVLDSTSGNRTARQIPVITSSSSASSASRGKSDDSVEEGQHEVERSYFFDGDLVVTEQEPGVDLDDVTSEEDGDGGEAVAAVIGEVDPKDDDDDDDDVAVSSSMPPQTVATRHRDRDVEKLFNPEDTAEPKDESESGYRARRSRRFDNYELDSVAVVSKRGASKEDGCSYEDEGLTREAKLLVSTSAATSEAKGGNKAAETIDLAYSSGSSGGRGRQRRVTAADYSTKLTQETKLPGVAAGKVKLLQDEKDEEEEEELSADSDYASALMRAEAKQYSPSLEVGTGEWTRRRIEGIGIANGAHSRGSGSTSGSSKYISRHESKSDLRLLRKEVRATSRRSTGRTRPATPPASAYDSDEDDRWQQQEEVQEEEYEERLNDVGRPEDKAAFYNLRRRSRGRRSNTAQSRSLFYNDTNACAPLYIDSKHVPQHQRGLPLPSLHKEVLTTTATSGRERKLSSDCYDRGEEEEEPEEQEEEEEEEESFSNYADESSSLASTARGDPEGEEEAADVAMVSDSSLWLFVPITSIQQRPSSPSSREQVLLHRDGGKEGSGFRLHAELPPIDEHQQQQQLQQQQQQS